MTEAPQERPYFVRAQGEMVGYYQHLRRYGPESPHPRAGEGFYLVNNGDFSYKWMERITEPVANGPQVIPVHPRQAVPGLTPGQIPYDPMDGRKATYPEKPILVPPPPPLQPQVIVEPTAPVDGPPVIKAAPPVINVQPRMVEKKPVAQKPKSEVLPPPAKPATLRKDAPAEYRDVTLAPKERVSDKEVT